MSEYKQVIIESVKSLVEARDIIFTQIVNIALSGEMDFVGAAFEEGDQYPFELHHFEDLKDINIQKLISLCKNTEATIFSLLNINAIEEGAVEL